MKKLLTTTALMLGAFGGAVEAAPSGTIQYSVAVCDPNSPYRCSAPDANGAFPVTFGASTSLLVNGKATTAAPTYLDSTNNPFSLDLSGNLRTTVANTSFLSPVNGVASNPTSTLTRPANVTAYAAGQLIASNTVAGSIVVPSFAIANAAGGAIIPRVRLSTNATTGWGTTLTMNVWTSAPTYTNGDGGVYAVATGGATHVAQFSCTLTQYGDAASGECQITVNNFAVIKLASGTALYWDLQATAAATPISGQTFTATAEVLN